MNLEKYTIAEEGILSKLKEKFSGKKKPVNKPSEINKVYNKAKDNDFDVRSIPKEVLDAEIELRRKEYLECVDFFSKIFKNKKKYFKDLEVLKNIKFELPEIKLLKNNRIHDFDPDNDSNFECAYFYWASIYDNDYNLWAKTDVLNIGNIDLTTNNIHEDEYLDAFENGCHEVCKDFESFLRSKRFKCIKNYAADGLEDFCLLLSIDIGPSADFLKQI